MMASHVYHLQWLQYGKQSLMSPCIGTLKGHTEMKAAMNTIPRYTLDETITKRRLSSAECGRCAGLLVNEWCYDPDNNGEPRANILRCVLCGHRIDSVILRNRVGHIAVMNRLREESLTEKTLV